MSKKKYVLDTSVLLHDAMSIFKFDEHEVILPITVIEEYDKHKKDQKETGRNARQIARYLNEYLDNGDLVKGISLNDKGGILRVDINWNGTLISKEDLPLDYNDPESGNDHRIINTAYLNNAIMVSNDTNLRIKASIYGLKTELYRNDRIEFNDLLTGTGEALISESSLLSVYKNGFIDANYDLGEIYPNKYFTLHNQDKQNLADKKAMLADALGKL